MLTLEAIKDKSTPVCRKYGVKRAYLFGSYARGEATVQSDVDIRVELDDATCSLFRESGLQLELMDRLQHQVDLLTCLPEADTALQQAFRENVLRDEVLLYEYAG